MPQVHLLGRGVAPLDRCEKPSRERNTNVRHVHRRDFSQQRMKLGERLFGPIVVEPCETEHEAEHLVCRVGLSCLLNRGNNEFGRSHRRPKPSGALAQRQSALFRTELCCGAHRVVKQPDRPFALAGIR